MCNRDAALAWSKVIVVALLTTLFAASAFGSGVGLMVGPPGLGRGGTNPVGIPPSAADLALTHLGGDKGNREITVSLLPGLLWGYRTAAAPGPYVGFGGGLITGVSGIGPGIYGSAGYDFFCSVLCILFEYKATLGVGLDGSMLGTYALRLGVMWRY